VLSNVIASESARADVALNQAFCSVRTLMSQQVVATKKFFSTIFAWIAVLTLRTMDVLLVSFQREVSVENFGTAIACKSLHRHNVLLC
jgi:hypothetical protein